MLHDEFRRAIEEIKLRAPIEDVVRERVPDLKRSGALWVACCPFHDEKTPSFKVDPRRGTWYCFGACSRGGDQLSFVESFDRVPFREALEILAARTGVDLPRRSARDAREEGRRSNQLAVLERAERFFREALNGPEGAGARDYLVRRGLARETAEQFGLGWAPAGGGALVGETRRSGLDIAELVEVGLARQGDDGRPYDFFRGRLTIPIRDERGRALGFGARLLDGESHGPKYVNTPETALFHKGRVVYGLDRALESVRKTGELVLVEGYTDVMAAHQAGLRNVAAVLGTATTEAHAALVRRSGARHVSLVFDGDEAGRRACFKALHGLLPLPIEISVVRIEGGLDPCDIVARDGARGLTAALELARDWFDFALEGLEALEPRALALDVDRLIEVIERLEKPVQRDVLLRRLAERLALPFETLLEERRGLLRVAPRARPTPPRPSSGHEAAREPEQTVEPRELGAWEAFVGAALADPTLVPRVRSNVELCPDPGLVEVLEALIAVYEDESATPGVSAVLDRLADSPARERVVSLSELGSSAESPLDCLEGALRWLEQNRIRTEYALLEREHRELESAGEEERACELARRLYGLREQAARLGGTPTVLIPR